MECQGTVRGTEIKKQQRMERTRKGIECKISEIEEKKSSVREARSSVMHFVCPKLSFPSALSHANLPFYLLLFPFVTETKLKLITSVNLVLFYIFFFFFKSTK